MPTGSYKKTHIGEHKLHPETQMMSYGFDPFMSEGAVKPPVFLTSTFAFRTAEDGAEFFDIVGGRKAPPEGQVRSIRYCGDTYTVETADGKSQKIWEFNLRLKSDSSKSGPAPRKPVVVGAGMQGDRASIVFASPKEISDFVKASCP